MATVEPVHQPVKSNTLPFPFNIREAMRPWDALYFTEGEFQPDSRQSGAWNRGAYLVQGPGHCTACHTPKTLLGGDKSGDEDLRGFNLQGWFAPYITGDVAQGLGQWSEADVTGYLKSGHNRMTAATGPMAEEIVNSTSQYNDIDLQAIATYLKSLPARQEAAPARPDAASMKAGEAIYRDQCSACHGLDGKGVPMLFP